MLDMNKDGIRVGLGDMTKNITTILEDISTVHDCVPRYIIYQTKTVRKTVVKETKIR